MNHSDPTPLNAPARNDGPLLAFTIAWHPDKTRIGEQFIATEGTLALSRKDPLFHHPEQPGSGLRHGGISREPIRFSRDGRGGIIIHLPNDHMLVELNGREIHASAHTTVQASEHEAAHLSREQLEAGVILGLGRAVLLCLHKMRLLPRKMAQDGIVGAGSSAIKVRELIQHAAHTDAPVLIMGEFGTGKGKAARAIHAASQRADAPLICLNMATISETELAEALHHSAQATLLLDGIDHAGSALQAMLLATLEPGKPHPRLIALSDHNLAGSGFNPALLHHLEGCVIPIPTLRSRREDIGLLMAELLHDSKLPEIHKLALPTPLLTQFLLADWPGNVRQLTWVFSHALLALHRGVTPGFATLLEQERATTRHGKLQRPAQP